MLVQEEPTVMLLQRADPARLACPAPQHTREPGVLEVPKGQGVQDDCPGLGWKVFTGQGVQASDDDMPGSEL